MEEKQKERFWRGPIESKSHAEKITRYTGIGFGVCGLLAFLGHISIVGFLAALLFVGPAVALYKEDSLIAAGVLLGLSVLGAAAGVRVFFCRSPSSGGYCDNTLLANPMLCFI